MNDHVVDLLERANPVPDADALEVRLSGESMLAEVQARITQPVQVVDTGPRSSSDDGRGRSRATAAIALAASLLAILISAVALTLELRDAPAVVDDPSPATTAPATSTLPPPGDPLVELERTFAGLVEAVNSNDLSAAMAQFDAGVTATMVAGNDGPDPSSGSGGRREIEVTFARLLAEGTSWEAMTCSPAVDQRSGPTIDCSLEARSETVGAVGGGPFELDAIVVGEFSITEFHVAEPIPGPTQYRSFLQRWLNEYHPDEGPEPQGEPLTDAQGLGRYQRQMAPRWASFLGMYECAYDQVCTITFESWVAEYDSRCTEPSEMGSNFPSAVLREHMSSVPPPSEMAGVTERLLAVDAALSSGQMQPGTAGELRGERADLMVEIGIDEACWPA